jgi:hypothetical protein
MAVSSSSGVVLQGIDNDGGEVSDSLVAGPVGIEEFLVSLSTSQFNITKNTI